MKIEIIQTKIATHLDVATVVEFHNKMYREATGVMSINPIKPEVMALEILESVKRHLDTIQKNILLEIERGIDHE